MISKSVSRLALSAALTGAAVLVAPGTAVGAAAPGIAIVGSRVLFFTAGGGVNNYPTVGSLSDGRIYLNDLVPFQLDPNRADGCVQVRSTEIHCSGITEVRAYLGDGNDSFSSYHNMRSLVHGQDGDDTIYGWFGEDNLNGGAGNDQLFGLPGKDVLRGDSGNDTIEGDDGPDLIAGGAGNDVLRGDTGADKIDGEADSDMVYGGPDGDTLNGGVEGDTGWLVGSGHVYGEHGDDRIIYDRSSTQYYGGPGVDTIDYSSIYLSIRVSLFDNTYDMVIPDSSSVAPWSHDAHSDIEHLLGGTGNDELLGNPGPNTIIGGRGNDQLWGSGGDDTLDAHVGSDQSIIGGDGRDTCLGNGVTYRESCEG